jgi:hypothetical protein
VEQVLFFSFESFLEKLLLGALSQIETYHLAVLYFLSGNITVPLTTKNGSSASPEPDDREWCSGDPSAPSAQGSRCGFQSAHPAVGTVGSRGWE